MLVFVVDSCFHMILNENLGRLRKLFKTQDFPELIDNIFIGVNVVIIIYCRTSKILESVYRNSYENDSIFERILIEVDYFLN